MPGLEGTSLGRYRLTRRLGRGGMSEVYLATDELMHREVAIKVMSSTHTEYIERFRREAEAIGSLQHDHILPAFDFGEQPPWHYLVMPYVAYCTLLDILQEGPISLEYAGELLQQIASGLQFAHDHGVIHRDIKPSNILLRDEHYAYLADFGLAKSVDDAAKVTQTGILLGTPEYMAPELADGPATASSDIYALGILLYQMVTGKMPFTGDTPLAVYMKQMREQPVLPSRVNPAIPPQVDRVIMRALEKDPRRRYDSPMALANAYMSALEESQAHLTPSYESKPSFYDTEILERSESHALPHNDSVYPPRPAITPPLPTMEPIMPLSTSSPPIYQASQVPQPLQQPEKLILPPVTPDYSPAREQSPPPRSDGYARQTPVYTSTPPRRPAPTPGKNRDSRFGLSALIGLIFVVLIGLILFAFYAHPGTNNNQVGNNTPQTTAGSSATPTSTRNASPQPTQPNFNGTATAVTSNTPLLSDDLSSNSSGNWNTSTGGTGCVFQGGAYHVLVNQPNFLLPCMNTGFTFSNGAIKVDLSLNQGSNAGIIFRKNSDQFYDFDINNQGQYFFRRHDAGAGGNYSYPVSPTGSSAINTGSTTNTLMVIANGGDFLLYINGTFVKEVKDSTYSSGTMGFDGGTLPTVSNADASFSNLTIYPSS